MKLLHLIAALLTPAAASAAPPAVRVAITPTGAASIGSVPLFTNFQKSGTPGLLIPSTLTFGSVDAGPKDSQTFQVQRIVNYLGGANGYTNSALSIFESVQPGAKSFE